MQSKSKSVKHYPRTKGFQSNPKPSFPPSKSKTSGSQEKRDSFSEAMYENLYQKFRVIDKRLRNQKGEIYSDQLYYELTSFFRAAIYWFSKIKMLETTLSTVMNLLRKPFQGEKS